jgi:hypothetical protein
LVVRRTNHDEHSVHRAHESLVDGADGQGFWIPRLRRFAVLLHTCEQYFCCPKVDTKGSPHWAQSSNATMVNRFVRRITPLLALEHSLEQNRFDALGASKDQPQNSHGRGPLCAAEGFGWAAARQASEQYRRDRPAWEM